MTAGTEGSAAPAAAASFSHPAGSATISHTRGASASVWALRVMFHRLRQ